MIGGRQHLCNECNAYMDSHFAKPINGILPIALQAYGFKYLGRWGNSQLPCNLKNIQYIVSGNTI